MNKQCYRVVFNKARGMLMVVSEAARSQGKTSNASEGGSDISQVAGASQINGQRSGQLNASGNAGSYQGGKLDTLRSQVLLSLGLATIVATSVSLSAHADSTTIVADRNAAANQQATILNTSNGKTQVNIQSPSAAGVSRNVFSKFDVGADGAILNNSRVNAQTQLAGWVEGNPYLARGEARVILNEVNSSDPSRLSGFTEIAGGRAELIIANPAGITCAGCGFINASRTTLTTGEALMDQGRLMGFDISKGAVRVEGEGLNTSGADYTQILAKTTEINAAVYAKSLDVITGSNRVSYETDAADTVITPNSAASNQATGVALDVSALGAMYAGKIRLIGTDKGMGVTNAGSIIASNVGGLQLDSNGNLVNSGMLSSKEELNVKKTGSINNSGTISSSQKTITLDSQDLTNSGLISSFDKTEAINQQRIENSGTISSGQLNIKTATLDNTGLIEQTGTGKLAVQSQKLINQDQAIIGQALYENQPIATTPSVNTAPSTANTGTQTQVVDNTANPSPNPDVPATSPILTPVTANGSITATTINNTTSNARISATGVVNVQANDISNLKKSSIAVDTLITDNQQLNNRLNNDNSRIQVSNADWNLAKLDNRQGQIISQQGFNITSQQGIDNTAGILASQKNITLITQANINNTQGLMQGLTVTTKANQLDNTQGKIYAEDTLGVTLSGKLDNTQGLISAKQDVDIDSQSLISQNKALVRSAKAIDIKVKDRVDNLDNSTIAAGTTLFIQAKDTVQDATSKMIAGMSEDGTLSADEYDLNITSQNKQSNQGQTIATGSLTLVGSELDLNKATLQAKNIQLNANTENLDLSYGKVFADDKISLGAAKRINSSYSEVSANQIDGLASSIDNTQGSLYANSTISLKQENPNGALTNNSGTIRSKGLLDIGFDTVENVGKNSLLLSDKAINITAQQISNSDQLEGKNFTGGIQAPSITINAKTLNNNQGYISGTTNNLSLSQDLQNTKGYIYGKDALTIGTDAQTLALSNAEGELKSDKDITLIADKFSNAQGSVISQGDASITLKQDYTHQAGDNLQVNNQLSIKTLGRFNNQAELKAGNKLTLQANNITNDSTGTIVSDSVALRATETLHNKGLINANDLNLQANYLDNDSAKIYGTTVLIKANTVNNQGSRSNPKGAIIASRGNMVIIADTINNQSGTVTNSKAQDNAWILSNQNLTIGGAIDDKGVVTANAKEVNNLSGRIESFGDMSITADKLTNKNLSFKTEIQDVAGSENQKTFIIPKATDNKIPLDKLKWESWSRAGQYRYAEDDDNIIEEGQLGQSPIPSATTCDDGPTSVCTLNYKNSDPVWAYFELTPPNREAPPEPTLTKPTPPTGQESCSDPASAACSAYNSALEQYKQQQKEYDTALQAYGAELNSWEEQDSEKYEALDNAVRAYNEGYGRVEIRAWTKIIVNERQRQSVVLDSAPAQIIAGGNMTLDADYVLNDKSQILAGGRIDFDESNSTLEQLDGEGKLLVIQNGTSQFSESRWRGGFKRYHQRDNDDSIAFTDSQESTIKLPVARFKEFADLSPSVQDTIAVDNQIDGNSSAVSALQGGAAPTNNSSITVAVSPSGDEIRSVDGATSLPNNSLYTIDADSTNSYLVETDPAFANYKNWLTSDYMLQRLKLDPNITQKRLGDGYYEQQYIRDQIMMLTGRYYLGDYSNQDEQYKGLMDAGISVAQTLNIRPGIALTASQVANLTSDIVWLEQQQVTLADGSTQTVLAPKVYVRAKQGAIKGDGSFIAAAQVNINLKEDLNNQGLIDGYKTLNVNANNVNNTNGGRLSGADARITADDKISNIGATIYADNTLGLKANTITNASSTYSTSNQLGASSATRTGIDQVGSIGVGDGLKGQVDENGQALTTLSIAAKNDVVFAAGVASNKSGNTQIISEKGDVKFNAINTGNEVRAIGDGNNYYTDGQTQDNGSNVTSFGNLTVAGNNVTGVATTLNSQTGTTSIVADNDVTFTEGRATTDFSTASKMSSSGFLSKRTSQERFNSESDTAISSNIEGDKVFIQAGQNISLTGTNALSDRGTQLIATKGDVSILAAQNTSSKTNISQEKKSGMFSTGGASITIGRQQTDESNTSTSLTHTASNVGAIDGNVIITAGGKYQQTGSNLIAGMGADSDKDINSTERGNTIVRAKQINIDSVKDVYTNQSEETFKQSGLTVSVSNSLIDSAQSIDALVDAGGNTQSVRMKGMAGAAGLLKVKALAAEANSAGYDLLDGNLKGVGNTRIQATIGTQKSQSNSSSYTEVNHASNITTNNLALIATGGGTDSNININGSNLNVTNDALFQADNNLNINAVAQNSNTRSDNSSSSAAIGGYASTGSGVGITASASKGKGYANSDSVTYADSQVNVGGTTTFDIGNDVNIKGGVINTNKAQGQILGDVNIESLQDTATYDSNQKNIGFTLDVALEGAGSSLSVNGGKTDINADYKAVGQQSGIFTGDGGFDLEVGGKTTLIGGAITTTDKALELGLNKYVSKGGITTQDIENTSSYDGDAIQVGISLGMTDNKPQGNTNGLGYGTDSDNDSSTTRAGITGIAGNSGITTDNREEYARALENGFDETRVNEELGAQVEITQAFDQERRKIKTELNKKEQGLREEAEEQDQLGNTVDRDNLLLQADKVQKQGLLFDAVSGAIYGPNTNGVTGYVAKAVSPAVSFKVGQYYKGLEADQTDGLTNGQQAGHILAHALLGAAVSYATGNDALTGGLSASAGEATAPLLSNLLYQKKSSELSAEQKDVISSITSLVGLTVGATTGNVTDAVNAAETSKVAVEENALNKLQDQCLNWTRCIDEFRGQGATYRPTVMSNGQWQLVEVVNKQGDTIGYTAYNKLTKKTDFIVRKNEIQDFMNATPILIANIVNMGNLTEGNPKALNQMQMSVMEGSFSGYLKGWQDGIQDPYFVAFVGSGFIGSGAGSIASRQISQAEIQQMARMSGMLRNVSKNKGNVGMGTATRAEAEAMGKAWVGSGYRVSKSDANVFVSSDGMRVYRAPTTKRPSQYNTTGVQANFEQIEIIYDRSKVPIGAKPTEKRSVIVNAHLNIKD
ncbi:hemagglutinin repeat-containing protein [Psychrobacter sp. BF1]|uniref:two-partner secretion domain-containing protein n=1 Tax=Psychrobacter sp. BF1 TaxID=2821147 RepID=UPI001C4DFB6B|nr:hemagglutinin repeat-containing protein [Psychrobacter sp. BF1]